MISRSNSSLCVGLRPISRLLAHHELIRLLKQHFIEYLCFRHASDRTFPPRETRHRQSCKSRHCKSARQVGAHGLGHWKSCQFAATLTSISVPDLQDLHLCGVYEWKCRRWTRRYVAMWIDALSPSLALRVSVVSLCHSGIRLWLWVERAILLTNHAKPLPRKCLSLRSSGPARCLLIRPARRPAPAKCGVRAVVLIGELSFAVGWMSRLGRVA
jgi:hypothetical protein